MASNHAVNVNMEHSEPIEGRAWQSFNYLLGAKFDLRDATTGHLRDIYFDDQIWAVRHLVSDPADRYSIQQVLVTPSMLMVAGSSIHPEMFLDLTREEFAALPPASTARPVCKQYALWNTMGGGPGQISASRRFDPHLRSCKAVHGYQLIGPAGVVGILDDYLVDAETWTIRQLVGRTETGGRAHTFLLPPEMVGSISWAAGAIRLRAVGRTQPRLEPTTSLVQAA